MSQVEEVLTLSAIELSHRLHSREVTAVDLLAATLKRIDEVNPKIHAIIGLRIDRDAIYQEAKQADNILDAAASNADAKKPGWLTGIPLCIKDLENAKGLPTTLGGCPLLGKKVAVAQRSPNSNEESYLFENGWVFRNAEEDDPYVQRLRTAGAIIIGKTNTPELGLGCHSYNSVHGITLNPYNLSLSAGGSSGGAAAALASHMLCVSDGSDMFGSLRNPAGWNNLYSLRPTSSWMEDNIDKKTIDARKNGTELQYPISTIGPMARCPDDLIMFLDTMLPHQTEFNASQVLGCSEKTLNELVANSTIGWLNNWGGAIPYEDGILDHCRDALKTFEAGKCSIENFTEAPFPNDSIWKSWMSVRSHRIYTTLKDRSGLGCIWSLLSKFILTSRGVKPEAIWECEQGKSQTETQLKEAVEKIQEWSCHAEELFKVYDFLALPSSQVYPFDASTHWPKSIDGQRMDTYHRWMNVMVPVTILGLPCVTVPCGVGSTGLPIGLSIFAKKGNDDKLLQLARWYHKNSDIKVTDLVV